MKTITEVIALFPYTNSKQWRQHENGKGWVFETAHVALTAAPAKRQASYRSFCSGNCEQVSARL